MSALRHIPVISGYAPVSGRFQARLADLLATYMAAFDMLGRLHTLAVVKQKTGQVPPLNTATTFADERTVLGFEKVPFEGAIDRIRNLTGMSRLAFDGLQQRYRMQAFTVAGTTDVRLIEGVKDALVVALEQGDTLRDFRRAVDALTTDAGVEDFAAFHLTTVFQTNTQTAYQNGKFEQMRDPAVTAALPYWKYWTVGDARVRPAHAALDGFVARFDDPVWRRIYPPTGYNCRCSVTAVGPEDAPKDADVPGLSRLPAAAASVPDAGFGGMAA